MESSKLRNSASIEQDKRSSSPMDDDALNREDVLLSQEITDCFPTRL
jgi:hypothetical protein